MKWIMFILIIVFTCSGFWSGPKKHSISNEKSSLLEYEKNTISVYEKAAPAVVFVTNISLGRRGHWLFGMREQEIPQGMGSGFIWENGGYIVTNYHVVKGGDIFQISLHEDKKQYQAKLVGVAPHKDIAVLKLIEKKKILMPIVVGTSSNLKVGQKTLAIGNPFGLDHSMSVGIVSALGRTIPGITGTKISEVIQTDAAINSGNSGGPLLNSSGELIGMNTMIYSPSGASAGVGFAIPVDTIKRIVPDLIKHGKVMRPVLGIVPLPDKWRERFDIEKGLPIVEVGKRGPADRGGLKGMWMNRRRVKLGDVILKVDKYEISDVGSLLNALDNYKIGDFVIVEYLRAGKRKKAKIKLSGDQAIE